MNRAFLLSSLVCSALAFGCGDDKTGVTGNTTNNPTKTSDSNDEADTGAGNSETGNPTTGSASANPSSTPDETDPTNASSQTVPGTSDGTTAGETGTVTFIIDPDGGTGTKECDVFMQDCPDGEKCSAYAANGGTSWDSLKCVPVAEDPKTPGDVCTVEGNGVSGIDDCEKGSYCWDTDDMNMGTCVALCKGSAEAATCDDPSKACAIYNDGVLILCLDACDPLAQDCDPSDVCIGNPTGEGFLCVLDASGEEGQQHDPCEYANACDPGLICNNTTAANECDPNAGGCCEPFCDLSNPNADADCGGAGQVCNPYFEEGMAPPGSENIGFCAIPM